MYTVGQVAKFLRISRDTLKFYEEKNLINPMQDKENGYRKYNIIDISEALTINFYRDIDIEIKKIQEIKAGNSRETIEAILSEKQKKLEEEIEYKQILLKRIKDIQKNYKKTFLKLNKLGRIFEAKGEYDRQLTKELGYPYKISDYSPVVLTAIKVVYKIGLCDLGWKIMRKKNNVLDKSFDKPFINSEG